LAVAAGPPLSCRVRVNGKSGLTVEPGFGDISVTETPDRDSAVSADSMLVRPETDTAIKTNRALVRSFIDEIYLKVDKFEYWLKS